MMPQPDHFYREAQGLRVSTLGIGTYLGAPNGATDAAYEEAIRAAIDGGINVIDTAINYRNQRSELAIGAAIRGLARERFVICTKAGYLTPGAVPDGLTDEDVAGRMHSMAPHFLSDQIERSRANLGVDAIDVFYLHNPETQLRYMSPDRFYERLRIAFSCLEELGAQGKLRWYGTATWDGFRKPGLLDLERVVGTAAAVAGHGHRCRFIQLPFNLAMVEAMPALPVAGRLGVTVIASASLLQSRLAKDLPEQLRAAIPGFDTDSQRSIQFVRSTPGIAVALAGMSNAEHVRENLGVARVPPLELAQYENLLGPA
jgi:aryl-alcohol dehydrogenase-like predicted oxidoreductase